MHGGEVAYARVAACRVGNADWGAVRFGGTGKSLPEAWAVYLLPIQLTYECKFMQILHILLSKPRAKDS